jgi:hypothetical protein
MWHVWGTGEVYARVWWKDPMEVDHLESLRTDGTKILKDTYRKWDVEFWTGLLWVRIGIVDGRL